MRYEKGHKGETHQRILDVAASEFRKKGIASVGIASIMKKAGLTNGAFYAHFPSKESLVKEVLGNILDRQNEGAVKAMREGASLHDFIKQYLSPFHRDHSAEGCPIAALVSELVNHSKGTRSLFTEKAERIFSFLAEQTSVEKNRELEAAISTFSLMLGALQLSRAVSDPKLSDQILKAATESAMKFCSAV